MSACLLGKHVRFDGGHKDNDYVHGTLGRFVDFVPVCPEVESGMSVPRESLRLIGGPRGTRLVGNRGGEDHTDRMTAFAEQRISELATLDLDGYVLKKDSPTCGLARVRVYPGSSGEGPPSRAGTGTFAAALSARLPTLPLSEEGWLVDAGLRESFLERIYTHQRMRAALFEAPSRAKLVAFHAEHKLLYMARSPVRYRELGRLVGTVGERPLATTIELYATQCMAALAERATPGKQANVLQHIVGYFKDVLTAFEKRELLVLIEEFRSGLHGLVVPLTLLVHHLRKHEVGGWLASQLYFEPYPKGLTCR